MAESFNDFVAGWVGGAAGIIVGSPLDVLKARLQAPRPAAAAAAAAAASNEAAPTAWQTLTRLVQYEGIGALFKGVLAPVVGLAGLNAILFVSYGSLLRVFERQHDAGGPGGLAGDGEPFTPSLAQIYTAGCGAGIACFFFSTPTDLVKIQAQVSRVPKSSWEVSKEIFARSGLRGFYQGGLITMIRDAPSYGIYFCMYEAMKRALSVDPAQDSSDGSNAWKLLVAGGMAGAVSWASIYPLDVVKSRLQMQVVQPTSACRMASPVPPSFASTESAAAISQPRLTTTTARQYHSPTAQPSEAASLSGRPERPYVSIRDCVVRSYRAEGISVFFRGLFPTVLRGFPVNAVTFYAYEVVMDMLGR